jgi:hypothetical protein
VGRNFDGATTSGVAPALTRDGGGETGKVETFANVPRQRHGNVVVDGPTFLAFRNENIFKVWNRTEKMGRQAVKPTLSFPAIRQIFRERQAGHADMLNSPALDQRIQILIQTFGLFGELILGWFFPFWLS